jgi:lipid-binding SYLF domain-containing protein
MVLTYRPYDVEDTDVYAFTFGQEGLMAGLGLQGSKITRLNK